MMKPLTTSKLIIIVALFLLAFGNISFFRNVLDAYPPSLQNSLFLLSLVLVFACVNVFLLSLFCFKHTTRPVLIIVLIASSLAAYFMDTYRVIIDDVMIDNIVKTDTAESLDLLSPRLLMYLIFLGVLPSLAIYKLKLKSLSLKKSIFSRIRLAGLSLVIAIATVLVLGGYYASFFREHKSLRYFSNPSYYLYSLVEYAGKSINSGPRVLKTMGLDAAIPAADIHRELVVLVVGETARADHFSLNGYSRQTNPLLEQEDVISFRNTWSCGTSTAVSVPCMFSIYDHSDYDKEEAHDTENVLDILQHAGVNVIWLDNNSDSKGVADRVPYISYKAPDNNPDCDSECRDVGMLENLQSYIDQHPKGDIFIVLHQMGNHGPAYYKRYPPAFEKFTPTCHTNQLENCTQEEIVNTYDNAILYTDYFLAKVINLLKDNEDHFEAMMFYISDHGESLGESGLYLHGLPTRIAPDSQKHVAMIMWFSKSYDNWEENNYLSLRSKIDNPYSHDNVFHTVLGLMEIQTGLYDKSKDIVDHAGDG